jgi:hypothetical protein
MATGTANTDDADATENRGYFIGESRVTRASEIENL